MAANIYSLLCKKNKNLHPNPNPNPVSSQVSIQQQFGLKHLIRLERSQKIKTFKTGLKLFPTSLTSADSLVVWTAFQQGDFPMMTH